MSGIWSRSLKIYGGPNRPETYRSEQFLIQVYGVLYMYLGANIVSRDNNDCHVTDIVMLYQTASDIQ